jgi:hypothetical protein
VADVNKRFLAQLVGDSQVVVLAFVPPPGAAAIPGGAGAAPGAGALPGAGAGVPNALRRQLLQQEIRALGDALDGKRGNPVEDLKRFEAKRRELAQLELAMLAAGEPVPRAPARMGLAAPGAAPEAGPPTPAGWPYKLFVLDRRSGLLVDDRDLGPIRDPIDPTQAVFLDNRLVFSTGSATIVIPGSRR